MKLKKGQEVLIKVRIVRQTLDNRPENKRGYEVITGRGSTAYIDPQDIFISLEEERNDN